MSLFICDVKDGNSTYLDIAKAAVKKLKTLRHPCILTYVDSLEVNFHSLLLKPITKKHEIPMSFYAIKTTLIALHHCNLSRFNIISTCFGD